MKSLVSEIAKKAFENSDSPSIFTDEYGFIVWCNQAFERISEYTLSEVKGKRPGQILQGSESDPKKVQVMKEAVANARAFELEIDNYTKSGKKYRERKTSKTVNPPKISCWIRFSHQTNDLTHQRARHSLYTVKHPPNILLIS